MPRRPARPSTTRRGLLLGAAALAGARPARASGAGGTTLLVPGPEGGALALWAQRLAATLARGAAGSTVARLEPEVLGGPDGVTAANRFATAAAPDGRTLLLLPGAACQARLTGNPRARFDPAGWLPVCGAEAPVLLASRLPLLPGAGAAPLRLALPSPEHPAAAALLGLDLLGIAVQPSFGVATHQAEAALAQGQADATVLYGAEAAARLPALGARAWYTLGPEGRDPAREAGAPTLGAAVAPLAPPALRAALDAAGAAARLAALLVLPALTPADILAAWRGAALRWVESTEPGGVRHMGGPDAAALLAALAAPAEAMQAYRDWLQRRLGWRPG